MNRGSSAPWKLRISVSLLFLVVLGFELRALYHLSYSSSPRFLYYKLEAKYFLLQDTSIILL
jgi:hypothetical protein